MIKTSAFILTKLKLFYVVLVLARPKLNIPKEHHVISSMFYERFMLVKFYWYFSLVQIYIKFANSHQNFKSKATYLKGARESDNFNLKWLLFIIKQYRVKQKLQKFTCKPQLSYHVLFIRGDDVSYVETLANHWKFRNFITSWKMIENAKRLCWRLFLNKINKKMWKNRGEILSTFKGMTSLSLNSKLWKFVTLTAQKLKFSIKDFFSKWDQIRSFPWIWSHLLKKSLMKNFIFCAMFVKKTQNVTKLCGSFLHNKTNKNMKWPHLPFITTLGLWISRTVSEILEKWVNVFFKLISFRQLTITVISSS